MTGTFDKIKEGFKRTADKVEGAAEVLVDPHTYTGSNKEREKRDYNEGGGKEPMNPEDIAVHEPTAVERN